MDIPALLYALTILHAGYLIQLSFRQPSSKTISIKTDSWPMWIAASPVGMIIARTAILAIAAHQAAVTLSLSHVLPRSNSVLQTVCPTPQYLDPRLFTWTKTTIAALALLYLGSYIRFRAYAQLGTNFTYRIAKPDQLVTSGFYAYVRHPSYTGLLIVLIATHFIFLRQRGLVSCWVPLLDEKIVTDVRHAFSVPMAGFSCVVYLFMIRRVRDEEAMMEREFGEQWRQQKLRTKKFVPYIY